MAKKKIAINIKLNMLGECNKKDLDRLLKKPFNLNLKNYEYTAKQTVEVEDPAWTPKIFQKNLFYSMRRNMQILAVRANDALKTFDKEKIPSKQGALAGKLKNQFFKSYKEMEAKADYNLKQIVAGATKSGADWEKGREAKDFMEDIEGERDDFKRTVEKMTDEFWDAIKDIMSLEGDLKMFQRDRVVLETNDKTEEDNKKEFKKLKAEQTRKRDAVRDRLKEVGGTFNTYRQKRGGYEKLLKSSRKKLHRMVDKKFSNVDKDIKKLDNTFKEIGQAAENYAKYLNTQDEQMMKELKPLLKFDTEKRFNEQTGKTNGVFNKIDNLMNLAPDPGKGKDRKLFSLIAQAKTDLKKIKAAKK